MPQPVIRPATEQDTEAVRACVAAAYDKYTERLGQPAGPVLEDYALLIAENDVFVLDDGGGVIGVLVLIRDEDSLLLDNVAVVPERQHEGLGRDLIAFAEEQARLAGLQEITLYTNGLMTENIDLFERLGYRPTERLRDSRGYERVYMTKPLAEPS